VLDAADSINRVAQALYGELTLPNAFYSPASLTVALAMTYMGARGETASQMAKVLHLAPGAHPEASFATLMASLLPADEGPELRIASRLYGQKSFTFEPEFMAVTRDGFKAPLETLDFTSADQAKPINDWVSEQTRNKIQGLIPAGALTALTRLVLVNAIYFKGTWQHTFSALATKTEPFFGTSGTKDAPLMHRKILAKYCEHGDSQVLELPYVGGKLVMDIILPKTNEGLPAVDRTIAASGFGGFTKALASCEVEVALPRFTITDRLEASAMLAELGMRLAFTDDADFSGMTKADALHIDKVFHKAFVEVTEEGTEAAAATTVTMAARGMPMKAPPPINFRADHPFVFLIRDTGSNALLFVGRLSDPTR
jgi:serpin B